MATVRRGVLVCLLPALLLSACATTGSEAAPADPPTLVINLTSGQNDLHSAWMGLRLAQHGLADGRRVAVFLNVSAPPLASKRLPATLMFQGHSIREIFAALVEGGASVIVCPECATLTGVGEEDLLPGVEWADRDKLFGHLNTNSVVFSY